MPNRGVGGRRATSMGRGSPCRSARVNLFPPLKSWANLNTPADAPGLVTASAGVLQHRLSASSIIPCSLIVLYIPL